MKQTILITCCALLLLAALLAASPAVLSAGGGWLRPVVERPLPGRGEQRRRLYHEQRHRAAFRWRCSGPGYSLCAGFLCGAEAKTLLYLPLVSK